MSKDKKNPKKNNKKLVPKPSNDGMNTPVPDRTATHEPSASEAALLKQAENPLGNPNKV
ncbi:hypothetical protein NAF17_13135 [Mucilaginibacter sp. RB4R14]|uniref:hypothetical protein n=1 Tax=Mucilaginibacter aurantiaciroseus TaxID=2949308 RepID=UPI0020911FFA|nr:hypothetical protein [Mucilaginibacter aurantiaciroseus]MCO5936484.1 hypothetical protein [Mucilaginibacter aurantiaciroseus]